MRAAVEPCTALINECNAGSVVSIEACLGAYIVCNYGEQIPYQLSGYNPYDMRIKCDVLPLCYDFSNVDQFLNRYVKRIDDIYKETKFNLGLMSRKPLELRDIGAVAICWQTNSTLQII